MATLSSARASPRTYKFIHWSFDDPAAAQGTHEEKLAVFRRIRDEIAQRINEEGALQHAAVQRSPSDI